MAKRSIAPVLFAVLLLMTACASPSPEIDSVADIALEPLQARHSSGMDPVPSQEHPLDVTVGDPEGPLPSVTSEVVTATDSLAADSTPLSPTADAAADAAPSSAGAVDYTVQSGDTLLGIALNFDVPMAAVQMKNDMGAATTVHVGQILRIPPAGAWSGASPFWVVHEVASGETLSELAVRYGLDLAALRNANELADADMISVGQPLILPLTAPKVVVADTVAAAQLPEPTSPPPPTETPALPTATAGAMAAAAVSLSPPTPSPPSPTATLEIVESAPPADISRLASTIFRLINEQRAAHALPPLAWSPVLAHAAQSHADDCNARGWCSHTGSDGSTYRQRMIRAGYNPVRWSECWAWYGTPERAVAMWMDEVPPNDPHRRTILSDYLTEVGVGVAIANERSYYFIADFGTPK
ncbi:MAG: CAP domain-containing protein [Anaerolineae bacterium]